MFQSIYSKPLSSIVLAIVIAVVAWGYLHTKVQRPCWTMANLVLSFVSVIAVLYATILTRTPGSYELVLAPFSTFTDAQQQPELYRELLMNIFLFFPFGLTLSNALPQSWGRWQRIGLTVITGLLLSVGIEYIQYRFALGVAETDDVICNTLGTFIGSTSLLIAHGIEKYNEKTIKHDSNKS
jgi:glycopeptide antibiotics resistance protein